MFFSKNFIVPGLKICCLIHFELSFTYLVGNLSFLFCKLPFVSHVYFSKFFSHIFLNALCIIFLSFMLQIFFTFYFQG